ncbi:acetate--CoA ligase family protein [uncultured Pseudacidovorax sp.]|uniref:acetate--CoA ligase family protein n=1 Tax=uncultured Pseudacidovorax sp. TaxID=679313 RepID=UPI0025D6D1CF|nr:acetate--CoA ligase family protein [uncultured Pseudacidovorax sp.]
MQPRSVAVVGASEDDAKTGAKALRCLRQSGFGGEIFPVNPGGATHIQGLPAYVGVAALPSVPDLVVVAVPGPRVPALLEEAAHLGCAGAVVLSSDVPGSALEAALATARQRGMRVLGPNSEGFFLPRSHIAATFAPVVEACTAHPSPARRSRRSVAVVSQSGGIGFALFGRALAAHLDVHGVVTTGNESDLEVLDFVEHLVEEGSAGVVLMFIEGLQNARRFAAVADKAAAHDVALVVMKVGRSEAGQRAAVSHTAHLAGADTAYDAVFARHGVLRVADVDEMMAVAAALSLMPPMTGGRTAVVTTSGGAGGWAADLLSAQGLSLPALSPALQDRLMAHLLPFASAANPVDTTVAATEHHGRAMLAVIDTLARSGEVDAIVVNMGLSAKGRIVGMAPVLGPLLAECGLPVLFHSHILPLEENLAALADIGAHGFGSFRACALALDALRRRGEFLARRAATPPCVTRPRDAAPLLHADIRMDGGILGEADTTALLSHYGLPVPPSVLVQDVDHAMAAAQGMGFPVVLKIQSPQIAHKTEVGGVALHVTAETLPSAFVQLMDNVRRRAPHAQLDGVMIQKMMPPGHEMVVGLVQDVDFGPLVMLGMGGIYIEVLKDVVFAPAPLSHEQALQMIDSLRTAAILYGARGRPPADVDALARFICTVGQMGLDGERRIDQVDFNPVLVYPRGEGVVAVDALVAMVHRNADEVAQ